MPTFAELETRVPQLRELYREWVDVREQTREPIDDYQAFRQHVIFRTGVDPGAAEIGDMVSVPRAVRPSRLADPDTGRIGNEPAVAVVDEPAPESGRTAAAAADLRPVAATEREAAAPAAPVAPAPPAPPAPPAVPAPATALPAAAAPYRPEREWGRNGTVSAVSPEAATAPIAAWPGEPESGGGRRLVYVVAGVAGALILAAAGWWWLKMRRRPTWRERVEAVAGRAGRVLPG